jgi:GT2 family glycosyltransferase
MLGKSHTGVTTAVIVHWGDPHPTIDVARRYEHERTFSNIVIVANDLTNRPRSLANSSVSWLVPPRNLGFGGGCNFGGQHSPAAKYAFLNADVHLSPEAISKCLHVLDMPEVGIAAPTLYHPDGHLQSGCGLLSRHMKIPRSDIHPPQPISECVWVTGASIFCRHEVFETIGFDGSYFLGFEDLDIAYRARLLGWKVVALSDATATHPGRTTLKGARPVYYSIRNQIWFARKYGSLVGSIAATLYISRTMPRIILADAVKRRVPHSRLMWHGLIAGWQQLPSSSEPLSGEPFASRWIDWHQDPAG